ncbi:MAG: hypothetical protein Q8K00_14145 [Syntrophales bacterium]|nr:hypothetical protein [Syntrophales bacterium]
MRIRIIAFTLPIAVFILIMPTVNLCFGMGSLHEPDGKGLYFYSWREVNSFLKEMNYSSYETNHWLDIRRNATGTELLIIKMLKSNGKALVVSCNGSIKEIDIPSNNVWLNEEYQALAWLDWKEKNVVVRYRNGQAEKLSNFRVDKRADPSGLYFMKSKMTIARDEYDSTLIYSIDAPLEPLVEIRDFFGQRIFSKGNKVYLFGNYYGDRDKQYDFYVFERKGTTLTQQDKVIIRRPREAPTSFFVRDFSPWDDDVLITDSRDFGRSDLYLYNIHTKELKKIGKEPFGSGCGFFLQCNIIQKVVNEQKKKN